MALKRHLLSKSSRRTSSAGGFKSRLAACEGVQPLARQSVLNAGPAGLLLPGGNWERWHPSPSQSEIAFKIRVNTAEDRDFCGQFPGVGAGPDAGAAAVHCPPRSLKGAPGSELGSASRFKCHQTRSLPSSTNQVRGINGAFTGSFAKCKSAPSL